MLIYNVTLNVDESIHDEWLNWIQTHIQKVLATGNFTGAKLIKVLVKEDMGGVTYTVQYHAKSRAHLENYYTHDAPILRQDGLKLFADKVVSFRTELQVLDEFSTSFN